MNLDFYAHKKAEFTRSVAAIRGFSYHGFRKRLMAQGYEFFELPNSISAIQLFKKKRTSDLFLIFPPLTSIFKKKT
ncbi:hypothetical protein CXF95_26965 [Paraglaciecola sp. MB-3u-78]|nr:hypothetical protein CXF95_26965 [Paraglaciecola sp. MB-3u-78]